jgi:hypothetical protein
VTDAQYETLRAEVASYVQRGRRIPRELLARRNACRDCGSKDHEPLPMLKGDVWLKAVPGGSGNLCRACIEKRLGRPFVREDSVDPEDF